MSKSLGICIYLSDEPETVRQKVMSMFTDPTHLRREDPGHTEGNPVFIYLDAFCRDEHFAEFLPAYRCLDELKEHYRRGGLGDVTVKRFLERVLEILRQGSARANEKANETLAAVRRAMRIDYFEDGNLLR